MSCENNNPCHTCGVPACDCTCSCPDYQTDGCVGETPLACTTYGGEDLVCTYIQKGDNGDVVVKKLSDAICNLSNDGGDKFVRISENDSTSGYFEDKFVEGNNVKFTKENSGLNERIRIDAVIPSGGSPDLEIESSDASVLHNQSGDKGHKANLRVAISSTAENGINKKSDGLWSQAPNYKVKVNSNDTPDFLENQIILLPDALGLISSWSKTIVDTKLAFTPVFNMQAICDAFIEMGCINIPVPCDAVITNVTFIPNVNGSVAVSVTHDKLVEGFRYILDSEDAVSVTTNPFIINNLSAGPHAMTIQTKCVEGTYGLAYQTGFDIPYSATPCPANVSIVANTTSLGVQYDLVSGASYTVELRTTQNGSVIQTKNVAVGVNNTTFTGLNANTQYYTKVIAILNGSPSTGCTSVSGQTLAATCSSQVTNLTATTPNSNGLTTLNWNATGAESYSYNIDGGSFSSPVTSTTANVTITSGSHLIVVRPRCANGAYGTSASITVELAETVIPCNEITDIEFTQVNQDDDITVHIVHNQSGTSFRYSVDNGQAVVVTSDIFNLNGLSNGSHSITVTSRNSLDEICSTRTESFTIPLIAPTTFVADWGIFDNDPLSTLQGSQQTLTTGSASFTNNGPISANYNSAEPNKYFAMSEPSNQPVKIKWSNSTFNFGDIQDQVWRAPFIVGNRRYYVTRNPVTFNTSNPTVFTVS